MCTVLEGALSSYFKEKAKREISHRGRIALIHKIQNNFILMGMCHICFKISLELDYIRDNDDKPHTIRILKIAQSAKHCYKSHTNNILEH